MVLSKCAMCNSKKVTFIKEPEDTGLVSTLRIKAPLNKVPLFGALLF